MMRRLRCRLGEPQNGFSLVEILVTMSIGIVCLGLVSDAVINGLQNDEKSNARTQGQQVTQVALDRIMKDLREATDSPIAPFVAFSAAGPNSVTFVKQGDYVAPSGANPASYSLPYQVTYAATSTVGAGGCQTAALSPCLMVSRIQAVQTNGAITFPVANAVTSVALAPISTTKQMFTYLACGDSASGTSSLAGAGQSVSTAGLGHIYAVDVTLTSTNDDNSHSPLEDRAVLAVPPTDPYAASPEPC